MKSNTNTVDLISRDEAVEALRDANVQVKGMRLGKVFLVEYSNQVRDGYMDIIRKMPAAEIPEYHYGVWVTTRKTEYGTPIRKCSYCGIERAGRPKSNYCPDCGAQMLKHDDIPGQENFLI